MLPAYCCANLSPLSPTSPFPYTHIQQQRPLCCFPALFIAVFPSSSASLLLCFRASCSFLQHVQILNKPHSSVFVCFRFSFNIHLLFLSLSPRLISSHNIRHILVLFQSYPMCSTLLFGHFLIFVSNFLSFPFFFSLSCFPIFDKAIPFLLLQSSSHSFLIKFVLSNAISFQRQRLSNALANNGKNAHTHFSFSRLTANPLEYRIGLDCLCPNITICHAPSIVSISCKIQLAKRKYIASYISFSFFCSAFVPYFCSLRFEM